MLGEHRPALADLLWERAQVIIKSFEVADEIEPIEIGKGKVVRVGADVTITAFSLQVKLALA